MELEQLPQSRASSVPHFPRGVKQVVAQLLGNALKRPLARVLKSLQAQVGPTGGRKGGLTGDDERVKIFEQRGLYGW